MVKQKHLIENLKHIERIAKAQQKNIKPKMNRRELLIFFGSLQIISNTIKEIIHKDLK